jgi:hypothetical protein
MFPSFIEQNHDLFHNKKPIIVAEFTRAGETGGRQKLAERRERVKVYG